MTGYYIFFTLFMGAAFLRIEVLLKYCGFLNEGLLTRAIFYAFLTSLGFARITEWYCIVTGS